MRACKENWDGEMGGGGGIDKEKGGNLKKKFLLLDLGLMYSCGSVFIKMKRRMQRYEEGKRKEALKIG